MIEILWLSLSGVSIFCSCSVVQGKHGRLVICEDLLIMHRGTNTSVFTPSSAWPRS